MTGSRFLMNAKNIVKDGKFFSSTKGINIILTYASEEAYWLDWLNDLDNKSFIYESDDGQSFSARKESRATSSNYYWLAYKRINGKLRKVYIGVSDELTHERLKEVCIEINQSEENYKDKKILSQLSKTPWHIRTLEEKQETRRLLDKQKQKNRVTQFA